MFLRDFNACKYNFGSDKILIYCSNICKAGGALFKSAVKLAIATGHDMRMFNDLHNCIIQISLVHLKELLKLDIN